VALTRYRLLRRRSTRDKPTQSLRSSVWRERDGRWQITFHQGTGVALEETAARGSGVTRPPGAGPDKTA
jgi:hypothetical protein